MRQVGVPECIGVAAEIVRVSVNTEEKRHRQQQAAARLQHTSDLVQDEPWIRDMLQHLAADHRFEALIGERQQSSIRGDVRPLFRRYVQVERLKPRSEEHTSELQSLMRISYAVFCLTKKKIA